MNKFKNKCVFPDFPCDPFIIMQYRAVDILTTVKWIFDIYFWSVENVECSFDWAWVWKYFLSLLYFAYSSFFFSIYNNCCETTFLSNKPCSLKMVDIQYLFHNCHHIRIYCSRYESCVRFQFTLYLERKRSEIG